MFDKLLRSANKDDVILGVILSYENLGAQWCIDNFYLHERDFDENSGSSYYENSKYKTNFYDRGESVLEFPEFIVIVGTICIEVNKDKENEPRKRTYIHPKVTGEHRKVTRWLKYR